MTSVPPSLEAHLDQCEACRELVVVAASVGSEDSDRERYDVIEELGKGGQSRVLRVFDRELLREVALKLFVNAGEAHGSHAPTPADRCLREVRAAAVLSHPAILPIHDMGVQRSGAPFYTMPIIDGPTLAEVVGRASTVAERLRLLPHVVQVCQAIGYAHEQGFVHRDVKPDNVMVGSFGETVLLDWGLARVPDRPDASGVLSAESTQGVTLDGSVVGTPGYMSPEQAEGEAVGPASDIWSLGAVLYFVLTRRAPFRGPSIAATLELVKQGRAEPIRTPDGDIPPELAAIVSKAMSPHPDDRYPTATALADDIIAFQSGGSVGSYRYDLRERISRFVRRYKALLTVVFVLIAALTTVALVSALAYRTSSRALDEAKDARAGAERQALQHHEQTLEKAYELSRAHVDAAERERERGHVLESRALAVDALRENPSYRHGPSYEAEAEARHPDAHSVIARARGQLALAALDHVEGRLTVPAPPELGATLNATAVGGGLLGIAGRSRSALVVRLDDGELVASLPHPRNVRDLTISTSGTLALTQDDAGIVRRWRLETGAVEGQWSGGVSDGLLLAVADNGVLAYLSGRTELTVVGDGEPWTIEVERPTAVMLSPDGTVLSLGNAAGEVAVFDTSRRREVVRVKAQFRPVVRLLHSTADSNVLAAGANSIAHVDPSTGKVVRRHEVFTSIRAIASSPDQTFVYAVTPVEIVIFRVDQRDALARVPTSLAPIHQVWRAGDVLYASSGTQTHGWRVRTSQSHPVGSDLRSVTAQFEGVQYTPVARRAAVARVDWAAETSTMITLDTPSPALRLAVIGDRAVTRHVDRSVVTWKVERDAWTAVHTAPFPPGSSDAVAASPSSRYMAIGLRDGTIRIAAIERPQDMQTLDGPTGPIIALDFDPTGRYVLSASSMPAEVYRWDLAQDAPRGVRVGADEQVLRDACFGANEDEVYVAGASGLQRWTLDGTTELIDAMPHRAVSYGSGLVAGQTTDFLFNAWHAETHQPFAIINAFGHRQAPGFALVPDRRAIRILAYDDAYELDFDAVADFSPP